MMLHFEAVSNELIELLRRLMVAEPLKDFYLVDGTALTLYCGHRKSIDLDLFTHRSFDAIRLSEWLSRDFNLTDIAVDTNTLRSRINEVKTDFIAHQYTLIGKVVRMDRIRLLSVKDIAAMKLNAIANRGSKKDFWDYAKLLEHFDHESLLSFYAEKYPNASLWNLEKSLCYFDDAENDPNPVSLENQTWHRVKKMITANCYIG